jgi:hypothetical protein
MALSLISISSSLGPRGITPTPATIYNYDALAAPPTAAANVRSSALRVYDHSAQPSRSRIIAISPRLAAEGVGEAAAARQTLTNVMKNINSRGSTAEAVLREGATGLPTGGRYHFIKAAESARARQTNRVWPAHRTASRASRPRT